ncbi:dienelactone hydrolase family protein [Aerosakkonema funiforme]|nr:dienelactone hydrolase family protein [Aerosakkonema funiforme]
MAIALGMVINNLEVEAMRDSYYPVRLVTNRGNVECRYYKVPSTKRGVIWVGGIGGDWDTPANKLYPRLCQELIAEGIASVRVRFRHSTILEEAILDVLAGISYLESEGVDAIALIGHSFGGAVVIQAGAIADTVCTVVTLATQSYGAAAAANLAPRCSILLIHGTVDRILPAVCSQYIYSLAQEPKHLILYKGADHNLNEVSQQVDRAVRDWIVDQL